MSVKVSEIEKQEREERRSSDSLELSDLVNLRLEGKLTDVDILRESEFADDYMDWLSKHGEEPTPENAGKFIELVETGGEGL